MTTTILTGEKSDGELELVFQVTLGEAHRTPEHSGYHEHVVISQDFLQRVFLRERESFSFCRLELGRQRGNFLF